MTRQFDEVKWPDLTRFRDASLAEENAEMTRIAARQYDWYANENPDNLPMEELAAIFQVQHYAGEGNLETLRQSRGPSIAPGQHKGGFRLPRQPRRMETGR